MRYLIIHAHHEPKSFNGAQTETAREALMNAGHDVEISDLCAMQFNAVSDRRNFTTVADADYLKQQREEMHATEHGGFASDVEEEIQKLERCDVLVFQFPLWWFGMPAILKGWCDRVLAMGRVYGGGKWYEHGIGRGKRAVVSMTTGGPASMYHGAGVNPGMRTILAPVNHGIFWFNGFQPVEPFITWAPARMDHDARKARLREYAEYLLNLMNQPIMPHLPTSEFDERTFADRRPRFMVRFAFKDDTQPSEAEITAERAAIAKLRADGRLLDGWISTDRRQGGLVLRAKDEASARADLEALPLAKMLTFELAELDITYVMA